MAKNETGILINIKAWLPTGKGLDEQFAALSLVKDAHASGDYAPLLAAAKIESVLTDSKTRRVDEAAEPPATTPATGNADDEQRRIEGGQNGNADDLDPPQEEKAETETAPAPRDRKAA